MALEQEMETYRKHLPGWTEHEGKFVPVQGEEVADFFSTCDDAIKAGYQKFGLTPFMVRPFQTVERVQFVSRLSDPCTSGTRG